MEQRPAARRGGGRRVGPWACKTARSLPAGLAHERRRAWEPAIRRMMQGSSSPATGSEKLQPMVIGELSQFLILHLRHYYSIQMITATEAHVFILKQQFNKGIPLTAPCWRSENPNEVTIHGSSGG